MKNITTRRDFIKKSTIGSSIALFPDLLFSMSDKEEGFRLIDYHVHLSGNFTIEQAVELSKSRKIKFGIVEHPGPRNAIKNDDDLKSYIDKLRKFPVFIGLQPVYRNWAKDFSKELLDKLDYI